MKIEITEDQRQWLIRVTRNAIAHLPDRAQRLKDDRALLAQLEATDK
jgi:hypothetical protein